MSEETLQEYICWFFFAVLVVYIPYLIWWIGKSNEEHERWLDSKRALSNLYRDLHK
jgi:Na+/proline symporter